MEFAGCDVSPDGQPQFNKGHQGHKIDDIALVCRGLPCQEHTKADIQIGQAEQEEKPSAAPVGRLFQLEARFRAVCFFDLRIPPQNLELRRERRRPRSSLPSPSSPLIPWDTAAMRAVRSG